MPIPSFTTVSIPSELLTSEKFTQTEMINHLEEFGRLIVTGHIFFLILGITVGFVFGHFLSERNYFRSWFFSNKNAMDLLRDDMVQYGDRS